MATLNDYLKEYLKNERIGDYASYLARIGELTEAEGKTLAKADTEHAKALPGYGATGDSLLKSGLSESGYADYLGSVAYANRQKARDSLAKAAQGRAEKEKQAALEAEEEEKSRKTAVLEKVRAAGFINEDAAYRYALALGLKEGDAKEVATAALDAQNSSRAKIAAVVKTCIKNGYYTNQSYAYALSLGYSEEFASTVAELMETFFDARYKSR